MWNSKKKMQEELKERERETENTQNDIFLW